VPPQGLIAGFSKISGVGPESGWKSILPAIAFTCIFRSGQDPRDNTDLFNLGKEEASSFLFQNSCDDFSRREMEGPMMVLYSKKRGRVPRQIHQRFFPVDTLIQLGPPVLFVIFDKILDELF
jgi:hypothetical protein